MKATHLKSTSMLLVLLSEIYHTSPVQWAIALILMFFKNLSSGFGFLMILPMLQWAGIPILNQQAQKLPKIIESAFQKLPIHMSLTGVLVTFFMIQVLVAIIHFAQEYLQLHLKEKHIHQKESRIYALLLHSKWLHLQSISQSSILQNLTKDINQLSQVFHHLMQFINQIVLALVFLTISLFISFKMSFVAFLCGLTGVFLLTPINKKASHSGSRYLECQKALTTSFYEQLSALRLIKSTNNEHTFLKKVLCESKSCMRESNRFSMIHTLSKSGYTVLSAFVLCLLIFAAIHYVKLSAGMFLFQLLVFAKIMPLITNAHQAYLRLLHLLPSIESLKKLERSCYQNQEDCHLSYENDLSFNHGIQLKDVIFKYAADEKNPVLDTFNDTFLKNKITVITGQSGAGKSTLLDILTGLVEPTSGDVFIGNQKLSPDNLSSWRATTAYLNQNVFLFNQTIRDNLTILCQQKISDSALWSALQVAHADEFVASFQNGLDTIVGDRGEKLSGGQRQRMALARALLLKPQVLILDEPTNALDLQSRIHIKQALRDIKNDMTIIIATHDELLLDIADCVIHLNQKSAMKNLENQSSPEAASLCF